MATAENVRTAPFGAITIYRATSALEGALDAFRGLFARRRMQLTDFTPAELEDMGLSIADVPEGRARAMFAGVAKSIRAAHLRRQTIRQLERLSDAQLDDIGISRHDIAELRIGRGSL